MYELSILTFLAIGKILSIEINTTRGENSMIGSFSFDFSSVYAQLTRFAKLENFWSLFDTAFGSSYDFATAASFRSQWQSQDFSLFPQIEVVSGDVLGSAKGAYAISTNRIYLSAQFVSRASQQSLEAVILEEFAHFVDAQVNATDTPGDEGELFSDLVRGVELSSSELTRIQTEDDHAVVMIGGQPIAIEMALGSTFYIQFGSIGDDEARGISTDSSGNVYVTGGTNGNLFIAKYDPSGTQAWIKQFAFGSFSTDLATGINTDSSGNSYVAGYTNGDLSDNRIVGSYSAFIAKYDPSGTQVWIKQFGSSFSDQATGISTDSSGNSHVTGSTYNRSSGSNDAFIAKYDPSGTQVWIKQFGTFSSDEAYGISTDSSGNIYVTGSTSGNLPNNSSLGGKDAFIAKYDPSGTQVWIKQFGSIGDDEATAISTNSSGNVYVTGSTSGSFPGNSYFGGETDSFIGKYDANGNQLWVKQFGSSGDDEATGISTDSSGNVYVTGYTNATLPGKSKLGGKDAFVAKYDASGNQLWVKQFGSIGDDEATAISTNSSGNVYVTGSTSGSLPGKSNLGDSDAFAVEFDTDGNLLTPPTLSIHDVNVTEGNNGTKNATFIVTRSGDLTNPTTIDYATSNGTATAGSDYTATSGTLTFAANEATKTISVAILGDRNEESDEIFIC